VEVELMSEVVGTLSEAEIAGLRADANLVIGLDADGDPGGRTTVLIRRIASLGTPDSTTGQLTPTYTILYSGVATIFPVVYRREQQTYVAETADRIRMYRVLLPWDSGEFRENDIITVTAADDSNFVNAEMRVTDCMYESDQGLRRLSAVVWEKAGKVTW
jgi:hypothetical protein